MDHLARATAAGALGAIGAIGGALGSAAGAASAPTNGIDALPPVVALRHSAAALVRVDSIAVAGQLRAGGEAISFTVRSARRGAAVAGRLTVRDGKSVSGPVAFVDLGAHLYLEAGAAFWRSEIGSVKGTPTGVTAAALAAKLAGRWIAITGSEAQTFASGFGGLTEPGKFAQSLLAGGGTITRGRPRVFRGRRVLPLVSSNGATILVSLTGTPLPLAIVGSASLGTTAAGSVSVTASIGYPARLAIAAPKGAVTLSAIAQSLA